MIQYAKHINSSHPMLRRYPLTKGFKRSPPARQSKYICYGKIAPHSKQKLIAYADAVDTFPFMTPQKVRLCLNRGELTWSWHPIKQRIYLDPDDVEKCNYETLTYFTSRLPREFLSGFVLTGTGISALEVYRQCNPLHAYIVDDNVDMLISAPSLQPFQLTTNQKRHKRLLIQGLRYWLKNDQS